MAYATSRDRVRIFHTTIGQGEPLVLSHGFTHTWESWEDLGYVDALKDRFRLVLIDSRGNGASDKPSEAAAYAMQRQVDDVEAVLDDLGIQRFHFLGYSIGAILGFHLAARMPERMASFIAYGGHPYPPSPADLVFIAEINATLLRGMQAWVDRMDTRGVFRAYPNARARRARLLGADTAALIASNTAAGDDQGAADALSRLTMPCLLIAGDRDDTNDLARRAARELPTADFVSVSGIGHAMVHAETIGPYVSAFHQRFGTAS
jgi:pimeloyl-ACP methyl ester carboxylesterase